MPFDKILHHQCVDACVNVYFLWWAGVTMQGCHFQQCVHVWVWPTECRLVIWSSLSGQAEKSEHCGDMGNRKTSFFLCQVSLWNGCVVTYQLKKRSPTWCEWFCWYMNVSYTHFRWVRCVLCQITTAFNQTRWGEGLSCFNHTMGLVHFLGLNTLSKVNHGKKGLWPYPDYFVAIFRFWTDTVHIQSSTLVRCYHSQSAIHLFQHSSCWVHIRHRRLQSLFAGIKLRKRVVLVHKY